MLDDVCPACGHPLHLDDNGPLRRHCERTVT